LPVNKVSVTIGPCPCDVRRSDMKLPAKGAIVPLQDLKPICEHFGLHDLWRQIESDPPAKPFKSDGCSSWPDTWFGGKDLYTGCFVHDIFYWAGRPGDELGRLKADAWLMLWVAENVSVDLGEKMFAGVRVGGADWLPTPWRWGFGR
jgi:hypothetical protein